MTLFFFFKWKAMTHSYSWVQCILFNSFFFFFCGKWWEKFPKNTKNILGYMQPLSLSWGPNFFYTSEDLLTSLLKYKRSLKQDQSTSIKLTPWKSWINHIGKTFFLVSRKNPLILTLIPLSHFFLFTLTTWPFFTAPIYLFIKSNE